MFDAEQPLVRIFLALMYNKLADGSHIFTVSGHDETQGRQAVFQRYRQLGQVSESFWPLFREVQATLDRGEICVVLLRSFVARGPEVPARVEMRSWTLTPLGIIPATGRELLESGVDLETGASWQPNPNVFYEDGWDTEFVFSSADPEEFNF